MIVRTRRPATVFAVGSTLYWMLISEFVGIASPLGGLGKHPYWQVAAVAVLPFAIYAVVALCFFHWFARRVVRQVVR